MSLFCLCILNFAAGKFDITIHPRATDGKPIEKVLLILPMPSSTVGVNATCNTGQYMYDPVSKVTNETREASVSVA